MRNRRTIIAAVLAAACVLVVAALFVFRSRPAPDRPAAKPFTPVAQRLVSPSPGSR
jgi:hypothetical protein